MPTTRKAAAGRETAAGRARKPSSKASPTGKRRYKPQGTKTLRERTWQQRFLEAFLETGTITSACAAIGVARKTVYNERQRNEDFALAFADADEAVTEGLEEEARRRALDGSDRLLEFLLKARRPDKYSDQHRLIHSGSVGSETVLTPEQVDEELAGFGMRAASAVAAGPDAVEPPEDA